MAPLRQALVFILRDGTTALANAASSLAGSYPHLDSGQRAELSSHLIGFVTWPDVVTKFGLPPECLLDRVPDLAGIGPAWSPSV